MSRFVAAEYLENIHRLALGIEPVDAVSERGLMQPVRVDIERGVPHSMKRTDAPYCVLQSFGRVPDSLCRHPSGRYVLLYYPGIADKVILRIYDHSRYYVPRRLRVPLMSPEEWKELEKTELLQSNRHRLQRRPYLFPGAAYPVSSGATGLRGRVERDGQPMRWAFIEAKLPDIDQVIGQARSDDRGEFFLVLSPGAALVDLFRTFLVEIWISGPAASPEPDPTDIRDYDQLWDLPLEVPEEQVGLGAPDNVSAGDIPPENYITVSQSVVLELGRILSCEVEPFIFTAS